MAQAPKYDEASIKVLKGLDGVRKRPAMYIGDIGHSGFHQLVWELIDNATDEAVSGNAKSIGVTFHKDKSVTVTDDGRGIPSKEHPTEKIPTVDVVFTILHAGGKFDNTDTNAAFKNSSGTHGVGASVVNALAAWLEVKVRRDGKEYFRRYVKGEPTTKALLTTKSDLNKKETGTSVHFLADSTIFKDCHYVKSTIVKRLQELSFLNAGVEYKLTWETEKGNEVEIYKSENGMLEYLTLLTKGKELIHKPIRVQSDDVSGTFAELVFVFDSKFESTSHSYANNVCTTSHGVHMNAALDALVKVIATIADSNGLMKDIDLTVCKSDIQEGLNLIVNVRLAEPQYEGQTKGRLNNEEIRKPLGEWFIEAITKEIKKDKEVGKLIATKIIETMKARDAAKKAKNLSRKRSNVDNAYLSGKLSDCSSKVPEDCELFMVEGDCFAADTPIHVKGGVKRLDEIQDGEMVYTHMHRYRKAIKRSPKVKQKKCRITLQGREFVCSEDHLFLVLRANSECTEWVPAKELVLTDLIVKTALV